MGNYDTLENVHRIFVESKFLKNKIYMHKIFETEVCQHI